MRCKSGPLHGQCNYMQYKHKRIYKNIGMEKKVQKKNKIKLCWQFSFASQELYNSITCVKLYLFIRFCLFLPNKCSLGKQSDNNIKIIITNPKLFSDSDQVNWWAKCKKFMSYLKKKILNMLPHLPRYWMITRPKYHRIYMLIYVIKTYGNVLKNMALPMVPW